MRCRLRSLKKAMMIGNKAFKSCTKSSRRSPFRDHAPPLIPSAKYKRSCVKNKMYMPLVTAWIINNNLIMYIGRQNEKRKEKKVFLYN